AGAFLIPPALVVFADRLKGYKTSKGTLQLPLDKPLDLDLVGYIARWRVRRVEERQIPGA
ncbi:hypothetical protein, partial [Gordonibacter sp.]